MDHSRELKGLRTMFDDLKLFKVVSHMSNTDHMDRYT